MSTPSLGIDAGATLCKLAFCSDAVRTQIFPAAAQGQIRDQIEAWNPPRGAATGGGAQRLGVSIRGSAIRCVQEFDAWAAGAPVLAQHHGIELPGHYLLVSVGTGTSILSVQQGQAQRVGGSALGGGTLLGLSQLLTGSSSIDEFLALAAQGDRRAVDLLVGDIYEARHAPLPPELTAASFAKLDSTRAEDLAHALLGMVGENISLLCGSLTRETGAQAIVFGGTTLRKNFELQKIMATVSLAFGRPVHFLPQGAFCGAIGAAALANP